MLAERVVIGWASCTSQTMQNDDVLMKEESTVAGGNATRVSPRRLAEARRLCALSLGQQKLWQCQYVYETPRQSGVLEGRRAFDACGESS
jgi:hypothetical protein